MTKSALEESLALLMREGGLPEPERQFRFCERRWRFDFAWPTEMLAVEVDGGTWTGGRHVRGKGYAKDCEKLNRAVLDGWRVLRFTAEHINSGMAIDFIQRALHNDAREIT